MSGGQQTGGRLSMQPWGLMKIYASPSCPENARSWRAAHVWRGRAQAFYDRGGSCWSAHVLPSGSLKVTNEPHG
jgi:hypothetical protein